MRVVVMTVDGLRPDALGCYGNEWVATPAIDRWAAEGVVFDRHYADVPGPAAAGRAWLTGRHAVLSTDGRPNLLARLRAAGVTLGRVGPVLQPDNPLASGWDFDLRAGRDKADALGLKPTRRAVRQALERLGGADHALLWVDVDALLPPWEMSDEALADHFEFDDAEDDEAPEGGANDAESSVEDEILPWDGPLPEQVTAGDDATLLSLLRTYSAAVACLDAAIGKLWDDCAKRGWGYECAWLLTAGRGLPLGEHGAAGYTAAGPYEELLHLPLLLRWPRAEHAGQRVAALTQPSDLAPTITGLFGLTDDVQYDLATGRSLLPSARGDDRPLREFAVSAQPGDPATGWAVRSAEWCLIAPSTGGEQRLFVKPDDRWEVNDVRQHHLELCDELAASCRAFINPAAR